MGDVNYYSNTYGSPNPLIRFAHRKRIQNAIELMEVTTEMRLLDYGCGDGLFLRELALRYNCADRVFGFEPFMTTLPNLPIKIFNEWVSVKSQFPPEKKATHITCFEVLEHFEAEGQAEALSRIRSILCESGQLIVSVPIECGLPSLPKNLFRWLKFGRHQPSIYNLKNVGKSIFEIPIPECRAGKDYLSHMGFYFRNLEQIMEKYFTVTRKFCSPFSKLGANFNSQVFYLLVPRS